MWEYIDEKRKGHERNKGKWVGVEDEVAAYADVFEQEQQEVKVSIPAQSNPESVHASDLPESP